MENKDLKEKYAEMHKQGSSSWFGQGEEERELILKMGKPWHLKKVIEIGCGEGNLAEMICRCPGCSYSGIDYSNEAIRKAKEKFGQRNKFSKKVSLEIMDYKDLKEKFDRIVMQGVLEHLDDPFTELKWMMDNLLIEKGDVITSSPCFLNPRGIVWMILDMLGAVMSKTDLHFIDEWEFIKWAENNDYKIIMENCDFEWGNGFQMVKDLKKRIPLALKDGNIQYDKKRLNKFMEWLESSYDEFCGKGATSVYRISK